MSFFAKPGPAICLLPLSRGMHRDFPAGLPTSGGKTKALDCSGYRYPSQRSLSPARPLPGEQSGVGLPEIQLVFSILFFVEKRRVVLFPEGRRKFSDHFLSHFIAVLADAGADTGRHISRIRAVLLFHGRQNRLAHAVYGPSPARMGQTDGPFFSGPENTAARSRQKMSPASRRAGL